MEMARVVDQLRDKRIEMIYAVPCESAAQSAEILAEGSRMRG